MFYLYLTDGSHAKKVGNFFCSNQTLTFTTLFMGVPKYLCWSIYSSCYHREINIWRVTFHCHRYTVLPTLHIVKNTKFLYQSDFTWNQFWRCSVKSAILMHSVALNFDCYGFLHFLKVDLCQINKIHSPKNSIYTTSRSSKIDFT